MRPQDQGSKYGDLKRGREAAGTVMDFYAEYKQKLRTPEEAVRVVKSGDWVDYGTNVCFPTLLDAALAQRRDELFDVKIRGNLCFGPIMTVESDPEREHFCYNSWHCSSYERKLCDRGLCNYIPMIFRNLEPYYRHFLTVNVAMMCVTPMDRHGFFNLSCGAGIAQGILEKADIVILEVNENLPHILGGFDESIHISDVDLIVEGEHPPLPEFPIPEPSPEVVKVAEILVPFIEDGSTLQLGIGSMPNVVGSILAQSDVKDLGMHTELCGDAYYELYKAGKLTNKRKTFRPGKGVTGIVFGSKALYDWVDRNPGVIIEPLEYVNAAETIARQHKMISINNCISVDLYGQVAADCLAGHQQSATGGQVDFVRGAQMAKGGKSFIALTSTLTRKDGRRMSRIMPYFPPGTAVTTARSDVQYVATEYGCVNLKALPMYERVKAIIGLAHPDYRDELTDKAKELHIL